MGTRLVAGAIGACLAAASSFEGGAAWAVPPSPFAPAPAFSLPPFHNPPKPTPTPDPREPAPPVPLEGAFYFLDDFEQDAHPWTQQADPGPGWSLEYGTTCSGHWFMHVGRMGPQRDEPRDATMRLATWIDLRKARHPMLTYDVLGDAKPEENVWLQPEVLAEGGAWEPVGTTSYGRYTTVKTRFADLMSYADKRVRVGFHARFNPPYQASRGLFLDNVQVIEPRAGRV